MLDAGEECDDGDDNGVELGDCSPDCSAFVAERVIVAAEDNYSSAFAFGSPTVVGVLDAGCATEFGAGALALFAHGDERRASASPYAGDDAVDWVLQPWTRYLNDAGELIWLTESIPLLGVDAEGGLHDLDHEIWIYPENNPAFTGMNANWTTQEDAACDGWTSVAGGPMASGNPWLLTGSFLRLPGMSTCGNSRGVYCVLP